MAPTGIDMAAGAGDAPPTAPEREERVNMKTGMRSLLALSVCASVAGLASARPIAVDFRGTALGKSASVSFYSGDSAAFTSRNLFVGQLVHRLGSGAGAKDFITYCIDLTQTAGDGTFNLVGLREAPVTTPVPSDKWEIGEDQADALNALYNAHFASVDTNAEAAAFQAAVWEIVFDWASVDNNTFALNGGTVRVHNNISATTFNTFVNAARARGDTTSVLGALTSEGRQDQLVVIPLPTAGLMATAGMLALGARRRRAMA
jgi:hypothetical protein